MLTYEPSVNLNNLQTVDFLEDIIGVTNITESLIAFGHQTLQIIEREILAPGKDLVEDILLSIEKVEQEFVKVINGFQSLTFSNLPDVFFSLQSLVKSASKQIDHLLKNIETIISGSLHSVNEVLSNFFELVTKQFKRIENVINETVRRLSTQIISSVKDITGFGIKADASATIFGFEFLGLDVEIVYGSDQLGRCGKYMGAYGVLKGQRALRVFGSFRVFQKLGKFIKIKKLDHIKSVIKQSVMHLPRRIWRNMKHIRKRAIAGMGFELALGIDTKDVVLRFQASLSFLGFTGIADVFVDRSGLRTDLEVKMFNIARARLSVTAKVFVPVNDLKFRIAAKFLPGGDDSFEGSYLDALKNFAKSLADGANRRLTDAQRGLTVAQKKVTDAQKWLKRKKADLDKGHAAFDAAIAELERAKQKVEKAKGPFQRAVKKLNKAQKNVDNLCRIRNCMSCLPGLKCRWCRTRGWIKIPYPCCRFTKCMIRLPNPLCLVANAACYVLRGIAYAALEFAKLVIKGVMVAMDIAKLALSAAQFIVDKSRVVIEIAKLAFDGAIFVLDGAKGILETAKIALEGVKFIVRGAVEVFNFIITHTIQRLFDLKECGFAIELSTKDVFIIDVSCKLNFMQSGWQDIRLRINFKDVISTMWEAAKSVVRFLTNSIKNIFSGRRKREISFDVNASLHKIYRKIRDVTNNSKSDMYGANFSYPFASFTHVKTIDVTQDIPGLRNFTKDNLTNTNDYEYRVGLFREKCKDYTDIDEYLTKVAEILYEITNESKVSIDKAMASLEKESNEQGGDNAILTLDNSGINVTDARVNYNITDEEINKAIQNATYNNEEQLKESNEGIDLARNSSMKNIEIARQFPLVEIWLSAMENVSSDVQDEMECKGFRDCLLVSFSNLYQLYENVDLPNADYLQGLIPQLEDRFVSIISNGSMTLEEAVDLSGSVLRLLNSTRSTKVFCATPPVFVLQPVNKSVLLGHTVIISCLADSEPEPKYTWFEDDKIIPNATKPNLRVTSKQVGTASYKCIASNHVANLTSAEAVVTFEESPFLLSDLRNQTVYEGIVPGATFFCNVSGFPSPQISWCFNHSYKNTTDGMEQSSCSHLVNKDKKLTITRPNQSQEGWYWCKGKNKHGIVVSSAVFLRVKTIKLATYEAKVSLGYIYQRPDPYDPRFTDFENKVIYTGQSNATLTSNLKDAVALLLSNKTQGLQLEASTKENRTSLNTLTITIKGDGERNVSSDTIDGWKRVYNQYRTKVLDAVGIAKNYAESETFLFQYNSMVYITDSSEFNSKGSATCPNGYEIDSKFSFICSKSNISHVHHINLEIENFEYNSVAFFRCFYQYCCTLWKYACKGPIGMLH